LTYGEIYEVFPFDNRLVHLSLSGGELRRVFEEQFTGRSWLAGLAGLQVAAACGDTGIRVTLRRPDGTLVEDDDEIVIATTNFLATGGDNVFKPVMPDGGFELDPDAPLFRDELTAWLEARGGTLGAADFYDPDTPRFRLPTALPMKCNAG
jgi:2',3'-cyclic-nucleotide 2'-phosphodiesterase (5'-nucleotidase family)